MKEKLEKEYHRPVLKTPPPPEIAYLDLDAPLFAAAGAGEQVVYSVIAPNGETLGSFNSAKEHTKWLEESEAFGLDTQFDYGGDLSELTRETSYQVGDFEACTKSFDRIVSGWVKQSGCREWVGYVSKASGAPNFRYDLATVAAYKGKRGETHKPHYLEQLRKHVRELPNVRVPRGPVEVDDVVAAMSQKKRYKGCLIGVDKDGRGAHDTHILIPDEMDVPEFSSKKIVGRLYKHEKSGKVVGYGTLFWLYQSLQGDSVDKIPGCKGVGSVAAYGLLSEFDGVCASHLKDAIKVVAKQYHKVYGETHKYLHHTSGEELEVNGADLFVEMSHLVYMKKSLKDECFWIPTIYEVWEEIVGEG